MCVNVRKDNRPASTKGCESGGWLPLGRIAKSKIAMVLLVVVAVNGAYKCIFLVLVGNALTSSSLCAVLAGFLDQCQSVIRLG